MARSPSQTSAGLHSADTLWRVDVIVLFAALEKPNRAINLSLVLAQIVFGLCPRRHLQHGLNQNHHRLEPRALFPSKMSGLMAMTKACGSSTDLRLVRSMVIINFQNSDLDSYLRHDASVSTRRPSHHALRTIPETITALKILCYDICIWLLAFSIRPNAFTLDS